MSTPPIYTKVITCQPLGCGTYHLELAVPEAASWSFTAGQYCIVTTKDGTCCPLSIATPPENLPRIGFYIRVPAANSLTDALVRAALTEQRLQLSAPEGTCTWRRFSDADLWVIAGGTGIAPVLSLLTTQGARPCKVFWGTRQPQELFAHNQLKALANTLGIEYIPVVESPSGGWLGETGWPHRVALSRKPSYQTQFLLAGGPAMVKAVRSALIDYGISPNNIYSDLIDLGHV